MGGVSVHNLDATLHVFAFGSTGVYYAPCLIPVRNMILPLHHTYPSFFAPTIPPFPHRSSTTLWRLYFPCFHGSYFYLLVEMERRVMIGAVLRG